MVNSRGQNGLQYLVNYFGATEAHFRLQVPINKASYLRLAKLLLDSGLDPNASDLLAGESVLFDAIRFNDKDMVALLLNYVSNLWGFFPGLFSGARKGAEQRAKRED